VLRVVNSIAERTATTRPTVLKWRGRYGDLGSDGPADEPRRVVSR
jgi:hypothetical protein